MGYIDLHVHSNKSDGTLSPALLAAQVFHCDIKPRILEVFYHLFVALIARGKRTVEGGCYTCHVTKKPDFPKQIPLKYMMAQKHVCMG